MFPPKPGMRAGDSGAVASLLKITALFPSPYAARPPPTPATSVTTVPPQTSSRTGVAALWTIRAFPCAVLRSTAPSTRILKTNCRHFQSTATDTYQVSYPCPKRDERGEDSG